jgi:hypothetical protein
MSSSWVGREDQIIYKKINEIKCLRIKLYKQSTSKDIKSKTNGNKKK